MSDDDLLSLDLKSFQILSLVVQEQSFTRAAERLQVSQSVVSYAVDKLRRAFDDPLFVRFSGKTVPTDRCRAIVAFSDTALSEFQALRTSGRFDPATTTERLVIACNYYERMLMMPRIATALKAQAPLLQIEIVDASGKGHEKLLRREADLLIGPFQREDAAFYTRSLCTDTYACLMDPAHPDAERPLTLDRYLALEHILITYGGQWRSNYISELEALDHVLPPSIRIPSPAGIEALVAGSQLVATMPSALARMVCGNLRVVPFPIEVTVQVQLIWTVEKQHSEMLKWVRDLIVEAVQTPQPVVD